MILHLTANFDHVVEIYTTPYTLEPNLTITSVDNNGTVEFSYGNESIQLAPGASWISPIVSMRNETQTGYLLDLTPYTFTVYYNRTFEIGNKGVFDK